MSSKRSVNLHVEGVPNPNAMKFVLENGILVDQPYEFKDLTEATQSPLARKLLMLRYVDRVMINRNYITVLKVVKESEPWKDLLFEVRSLIHQHLERNDPILYIGTKALRHIPSEDAIIVMVKQLLDRQIRPAAQEDGGDILFESYENGILNLTMHGSCHGCPYVMNTMKDGVEKLITNMIPEVKRVTATANNVL